MPNDLRPVLAEKIRSAKHITEELPPETVALVSVPWPECAASEAAIMTKYGIDILDVFLKHGIDSVSAVDEVVDAIAKNASAISRIKNVHEEARARRAQKDGI